MSEALTQLEAATFLTLEITDLGPHAHEKEIFDTVYHFLDFLDYQDSARAYGDAGTTVITPDELDEEEVVELTPECEAALDSYNVEAEFEPTAYDLATGPTVGTLGGQIKPVDGGYDVHFNGRIYPFLWLDSAEQFLQDAKAGAELSNFAFNRSERGFNTGKTLDEAFGPCGAD